ncbi:MAG: alpha-L-rhamnosidase C-terminal domain-containing protein, partial [Paludibacter sp.]
KIATNRTYPSWGYMIDNGATTIWELWNGNTADPAMNSGNHVMLLGDLLSWYYESLGGIQTDKSEVGFKKIILKPIFPAGLNFVKTSHNSPYGMIKSEWKRVGETLNWQITIPANTSAIIYLPENFVFQKFNKGKEINNFKILNISKTDNGFIRLNIGSGDYDFKIKCGSN